MLKTTILTLILTASSAWAQQPATSPSASDSRGSDKLDIKKLEQKYWAAKDDDFSVVQNRRYAKADRFYFNVGGGVPINDPFGTGTMFSGQLGYFFNERWGLDINYTTASLSDNDNTKQFIDEAGVAPNYNFFKGSQMISLTYVPLYAKMSFVDKAIIYFDMGISLGVGMVDYDIQRQEGPLSKSAFSYQIGINQQIFFSEHWAIRVDFINKFTTEERQRYRTVPKAGDTAPRDRGTTVENDTSLLLGLTYWH